MNETQSNFKLTLFYIFNEIQIDVIDNIILTKEHNFMLAITCKHSLLSTVNVNIKFYHSFSKSCILLDDLIELIFGLYSSGTLFNVIIMHLITSLTENLATFVAQ